MSGASEDYSAYTAKLVAYQARRREVQGGNKAALFEVLSAAGIGTVVVTFDGSGDAGQIEDVSAYDAAGADTALPDAHVALADVDFDTLATVTEACGLREVIDSMAYGLLERVHDGWENGDGAHGEFTFTVVGRAITLDYNERYTASDYHQHEF